MACRLSIFRSYHLIMLLSTKTIVESPIAIINNLWSATELENTTATRGNHHQPHLHLHCLPHPHQDQQLYQDKEAMHPECTWIRNRNILSHMASTFHVQWFPTIYAFYFSHFDDWYSTTDLSRVCVWRVEKMVYSSQRYNESIISACRCIVNKQ